MTSLAPRGSGADKSVRVLHVIHSGALGGGPEVVRMLALADTGTVDAVVSSDDGPLLGDISAEGVETFEVPMSRRVDLPAAIVRLRRLLRDWRPDVVVSYGQFAGAVSAGATLGIRCKVIYSAQWPSFYSDRGLWTYCRNWLIERMTTGLADVVVVLSTFESREYERRRIQKSRDQILIPNAVDTIRFRPNPSISPGKRIAFVGRLTHDKGVDVLMQSLALLPPSVRENLEVEIVGTGEEEDRLVEDAEALLEAMAPPAPTIRFRGPLRVERDWFAEATVIVVPSRQEPFGIVALESMACGVCTIASRIGGLAETIEHGVSGVLVEPGSARELAEALQRILEDDDYRARIASGGLLRATSCYSFGHVVERYRELYVSSTSPV